LVGTSFTFAQLDSKNRIAEGETSYFRHEHAGKDDRVFYSIDVPNPVRAITLPSLLSATWRSRCSAARCSRQIQFGGPFTKNGFRSIGDRGIDVTDIVNVIEKAGGLTQLPTEWIPIVAITELGAQGFLDSNWVPAAAKIVEKIEMEMAN
jgi:hypothetical protein